MASISEDGILQSMFEQSVFGIIKDLAILSRNDKFHEPMCQERQVSCSSILNSFVFFCTALWFSKHMYERDDLSCGDAFILDNATMICRERETTFYLSFLILESFHFLLSVLRCIG